MRPTFTVDLHDSLEQAARKLRENGCDVLPVTENDVLAGAVTQASLTAALAEGRELTEAVELISQGALTATPTATGAEALRLFEHHGSGALVVIDASGRVLGILTPSDLYPKPAVAPRPSLVGGMATPFGVYLTTGSIRAGAGHIALVTTGLCLFALMFTGNVLGALAGQWLVAHGLSAEIEPSIEAALVFVFFLLGMRLIPLSGIHAAEHKVVHAIERGEALVPAIVRRMPRVHPRCGTNIAVGASILFGIGAIELSNPVLMYLKLPVAAIATLVLWRPLGNTLQYLVTTRPPTDKQIDMGIRAGQELLAKYAASAHGRVSVAARIVNSGILHVIGGSLAGAVIVAIATIVFHLPPNVGISIW